MSKIGEDVEKPSKLVPVPIDSSAYALLGTNMAIGARCGICVHHGTIAHPAYDDVCKELGILSESVPCKRYEPDYRQLKLAEEPWFAAMAAAIASMTGPQRHILASILVKENRTRAAGFQFGEQVYLRVYEGEYLSNYRKAVVVSAGTKYVRLEGANGFHAMVYKRTVMNARQWLRKKAELVKAGRVKDPMLRRHTAAATDIDRKMRELIDEDKLAWIEAQTREITGVARVEKTAPNKGTKKSPRYMTLVELIDRTRHETEALGTIRTRASNSGS